MLSRFPRRAVIFTVMLALNLFLSATASAESFPTIVRHSLTVTPRVEAWKTRPLSERSEYFVSAYVNGHLMLNYWEASACSGTWTDHGIIVRIEQQGCQRNGGKGRMVFHYVSFRGKQNLFFLVQRETSGADDPRPKNAFFGRHRA